MPLAEGPYLSRSKWGLKMRPEMSKEQPGFSLIELIIAMFVTLIVSGAIYGLLATGQSAFRREPALTDRQQNIRVAMDMLQQDIAKAGMLLPPFVQAFTDGLDGYGYRDEAGNAFTGYPSPYGKPPDAIEIFGNSGLCPQLTLCDSPTGASIKVTQLLPPCVPNPSIVLIANPQGSYDIEWVCKPGAGAVGGNCTGSTGQNGHAVDPAGRGPTWNEPGGLPAPPCAPGPACDWNKMTVIEVVRYEVRVDAEGIPSLWRSPTGGANNATGGSCGSQLAFGTNNTNWWLVARGIEDFQVEYMNGDRDKDGTPDSVWDPRPGTTCAINSTGTCASSCDWSNPASCTTAEYAALVRQVRVTLTARVTDAANLTGQTKPTAGAVSTVRGQLVSVTTPRAALFTLSQAPSTDLQQWQ